MAKRKAKQAARSAHPARKASSVRRSAKRPTIKKSSGKKRAPARRAKTTTRGKAKSRPVATSPKASSRKAAPKAVARKTTKPLGPPPRGGAGTRTKLPQLDRARRTLEETVPGPPSSLDMDRHGSAARTGRAEIAETLRDHRGMTAVTGGDVDVNIEDAYFTGEEAPGGDNPTPDQDVVDDIGKALGVEYEDNEELKASEKVVERDRHRWELDPASSEDYKERK
jgi:hypothetical protein